MQSQFKPSDMEWLDAMSGLNTMSGMIIETDVPIRVARRRAQWAAFMHGWHVKVRAAVRPSDVEGEFPYMLVVRKTGKVAAEQTPSSVLIGFWSRVVVAENADECFGWTGARDGDGYGTLPDPRMPGGSNRASRIAWEIEYGPIPIGMDVLHSCDNPVCTNAKRHLHLGGVPQNMREMVERHRRVYARGDDHVLRKNPDLVLKGDAHPDAKLTAEIVLNLRYRHKVGGEVIKEMAKEYPMVGYQAIFKAVTGITWKSLPADTLPDKQARGALTSGERNTQSDLTKAQVLAIRAEWETVKAAGKESMAAFSRRVAPNYGVGTPAIVKVVRRVTWRDLEPETVRLNGR